MKNKNIFVTPFLGKSTNGLKSTLILTSIAVGASIGYYLLKRYGLNKTLTKPAQKFGAFINDVRADVKNASEHLLSDNNNNHDPIKINVPEAGTLNWKKNREKSMFPPIPDSNIRIN